MKRERSFQTEAEMCSAFSAWALRQGWVSYNETSGWDILLVAADGTQIGIQAKLKFNLKVLEQCLPAWYYDAVGGVGPDFRSILVPTYGAVCKPILDALGVGIFYYDGYGRFCPELGRLDGRHYWNPSQRCKLPAYVPDVPAGASGPVQLTEWKISALRIVALLEIRGYITREDFKRNRIDPRRWTGYFPEGQEWLLPGETPGQYVKGPGLKFAEQHPIVFAQIKAEVEGDLQTL